MARIFLEAQGCFESVTERGLLGVLPGTGPVLCTGDSTLTVLDEHLQPASRHRVKGMALRLLRQDGRTYVLAYARGRAWTRCPKDSPPYTVVERPDCLRLYELLRK